MPSLYDALGDIELPWKLVRQETEGDAGQALKKKARFLVDHSLGTGVAQVLRQAEWNTKEVGELGYARHSDEAVFSLAWKERRILLTHDQDFWDDRRFPPERNPGLVILPGGSGDETALIVALRLIVYAIAPSEVRSSAVKHGFLLTES